MLRVLPMQPGTACQQSKLRRPTETRWILEVTLVSTALLAAVERGLLLAGQLLEEALVHGVEALQHEVDRECGLGLNPVRRWVFGRASASRRRS